MPSWKRKQIYKKTPIFGFHVNFLGVQKNLNSKPYLYSILNV